jgi:hypothetical protein
MGAQAADGPAMRMAISPQCEILAAKRPALHVDPIKDHKSSLDIE